MKPEKTPKLLATLLCVFAAGLFWMIRSDERKPGKVKIHCQREIDFALQKSILDSIPTFDRIIQLAASNRIDEAQSMMCQLT